MRPSSLSSGSHRRTKCKCMDIYLADVQTYFKPNSASRNSYPNKRPSSWNTIEYLSSASLRGRFTVHFVINKTTWILSLNIQMPKRGQFLHFPPWVSYRRALIWARDVKCRWNSTFNIHIIHHALHTPETSLRWGSYSRALSLKGRVTLDLCKKKSVLHKFPVHMPRHPDIQKDTIFWGNHRRALLSSAPLQWGEALQHNIAQAWGRSLPVNAAMTWRWHTFTAL